MKKAIVFERWRARGRGFENQCSEELERAHLTMNPSSMRARGISAGSSGWKALCRQRVLLLTGARKSTFDDKSLRNMSERPRNETASQRDGLATERPRNETGSQRDGPDNETASRRTLDRPPSDMSRIFSTLEF